MAEKEIPMHSNSYAHSSFLGWSRRAANNAALIMRLSSAFLIFSFLFLILTSQPQQAQTFQVIYNFNGGPDGSSPDGLTIDAAGNLYGTAFNGGQVGNGTVFELAKRGSGWIFIPLYSFQGGTDGANPYARPNFGLDGGLYGTTVAGGGSGCSGGNGCGTVYRLTPPAHPTPTVAGGWTESVLHRFHGADGSSIFGDVKFDPQGNLYGTAYDGGTPPYPFAQCGLVYELVPAGGNWTEKILHNFIGLGDDGCYPPAGVILDEAGNLYGVTVGGGSNGFGVVFELTSSGTTWNYSVLHSFDGYDGLSPEGGLIFDQHGTLYGTAASDFYVDGGTVFAMSAAGGSWTFNLLYELPGTGVYGPLDRLAMDAAGNLYGTTNQDGAYGLGSIFKLAPASGGWNYTDLHDFTGGSDGSSPFAGVTLDDNGVLYGSATAGGTHGAGVIWEVIP
jgi:uncharacterized repeat protein (TIGR03803 family)